VPVGEPGIVDILLWGVLPYVTILILIGGTIWRYRTDQFSWTTRSSQIYESKMLRLGSPLFHYGLAAVFMGHVGGLVVPKMLTDYVVDDHTYHIVALVGGSAAALATIAGLALLLWRRRNNAQVFTATTANDKFMYFVLVAVILAGTAATLFSAINPSRGPILERRSVANRASRALGRLAGYAMSAARCTLVGCTSSFPHSVAMRPQGR